MGQACGERGLLTSAAPRGREARAERLMEWMEA